MADDFEKAVLFSFDQSGNVDAALKVQTRLLVRKHLLHSPKHWMPHTGTCSSLLQRHQGSASELAAMPGEILHDFLP